jgi:hypothetical protein
VALCVATTAYAAPWSFELPAGYTEHPDSAGWKSDQLGEQPNTVSIDGQVFQSPDDQVRLTRMTLGFELAAKDRGRTHVSISREFRGDQLVSEQVDEVEGLRVQKRRIYAADSSGIVHVFSITCAGPANQLADCVKAQQTMVLMLPNQAPLDMTVVTPKQKPARTALIVQILGGVLVLVLVIWYVVRRRRER